MGSMFPPGNEGCSENQIIKPTYRVIPLYRRSTAVSLETYSFYIKINSWKINGILFLLTNRLNKRSQLDKNVNRFAKSIDKKGKTTSARDTNITIK